MSFDLSKMDKTGIGNHPRCSLCWAHWPGFSLSWLLTPPASPRKSVHYENLGFVVVEDERISTSGLLWAL